MKRKTALILIVFALLSGFGAAMGYSLMQKKRYQAIINQLQQMNLQCIYQLHNYRPVTGLNDDGVKEEQFFIKIEQGLPLRIQVSLMATALSKNCFSYLPIEVQGIQEYDQKKVAVINLRELEGFDAGKAWHGASWAQGYFQGSSGGAATTVILAESFLQRNNPMPWIDGVVFLYEEHPIRNFEHVASLERTIFRD